MTKRPKIESSVKTPVIELSRNSLNRPDWFIFSSTDMNLFDFDTFSGYKTQISVRCDRR